MYITFLFYILGVLLVSYIGGVGSSTLKMYSIYFIFHIIGRVLCISFWKVVQSQNFAHSEKKKAVTNSRDQV